jgi:hypothetical protein
MNLLVLSGLEPSGGMKAIANVPSLFSLHISSLFPAEFSSFATFHQTGKTAVPL